MPTHMKTCSFAFHDLEELQTWLDARAVIAVQFPEHTPDIVKQKARKLGLKVVVATPRTVDYYF